MFALLLLVFLGIFLVFACWSVYYGCTTSRNLVTDYVGLGLLVGFFSLLFIFFAMLHVVVNPYSAQVEDLQQLQAIDETKDVYTQQKEELSKQFTQILGKDYPEIEKNLYKDPNVLVKVYPQIHSHETLMKLVNELKDLTKKIVDTDIAKIEVNTKIRKRLKDPTILNFIMPDQP